MKDDSVTRIKSSREFAGKVIEYLLEKASDEPTSVFADVALDGPFGGHAVAISCRYINSNSGNVQIDYFDPNFGQIRLTCPKEEAVKNFTEFFTDLMARTSYSIGFTSFDYRIMK